MSNANTIALRADGRVWSKVSMSKRMELCEARVTLDGHRAKISGYGNDFATIRDTVTGNAPEFAWETVQRIVARDGKFRDMT